MQMSCFVDLLTEKKIPNVLGCFNALKAVLSAMPLVTSGSITSTMEVTSAVGSARNPWRLPLVAASVAVGAVAGQMLLLCCYSLWASTGRRTLTNTLVSRSR